VAGLIKKQLPKLGLFRVSTIGVHTAGIDKYAMITIMGVAFWADNVFFAFLRLKV
jgi:hypothetical protein